MAVVPDVRELGDQLLLKGQALAVARDGGVIAGQSCMDSEGFAVFGLRLRRLPQVRQQPPQIVVVLGQALAVFRDSGELSEDTTTHRPIYYTELDNLGKII